MENSLEQTSSIGASWPPVVASNQRLRGFYTEALIADQQSADNLAEHVQAATEEMFELKDITRVSIRAVVDQCVLPRLTFEHASVEAAIPIRDTELLVAYIGANQAVRQMRSEHISAHRKLLRSAVDAPSSPDSDVPVKIVTQETADDLIADFAQLYSIFGYGIDETRELLASPSNIIAYQQVQDKVVSTAMAERGSVLIPGFGDLNLVEITEASTHPEHRKKGFYRHVSGHLMRHLVSSSQEGTIPIDVLYGESNLAMPGVIIAASQNGRRFSFFDRERLGRTEDSFGILPQNFAVADGSETRCYNDFAVSYVSLEGML